ncbi:MAG: hypothetical protein Q6370_020335, partial [Candidatus Sigynarchaeota archaeon]
RVRKDIASSADFVKAIQAGTINIPDFTGKVLGWIKERFAERRLQSIADTLNDLKVRHRGRMYDLAGKYFLDREYVVERLRGKDFSWQVVSQKGKEMTIDFRLAAMPRGATSIDDALLIVPHEQKASKSITIGRKAKEYVGQMLQQFVREVGQRGGAALTRVEMEKRVRQQFVRFWDIIPDKPLMKVDEIMKLDKVAHLKGYLSTLDPATRSKILIPPGMVEMLDVLMAFPSTTIESSSGTNINIATVSDFRVTFEKTNPASGQHAWVVRFDLTPANPAGTKAIPVRLIVGWHQAISTRAEYEARIHDVFRKWLDDAGVPYPPGL